MNSLRTIEYLPPNRSLWQGRKDSLEAQRIHDAIELVDLTHWPTHDLDGAIGLIGFASDDGVRRNQGRPGAAQGPDAMRHALAISHFLKPESSTLALSPVP